MRVFIGFDIREPRSYLITRYSLLKHSTVDIDVRKLGIRRLLANGIYTRQWSLNDDNQRIDSRDGKPFSTEFSFTRFLVPYLCDYRGWALFVDGDFLFTQDVARLFSYQDDQYAVQVVKHNHHPVEKTKMDDVIQTRYFRKNWSSLVLWNCGHPSNMKLSPYLVNHATGQYLHAFSWLQPDEIGTLPRGWNFLAGVEKVPPNLPNAIHYTLGTPEFEALKDGPYANIWLDEWNEYSAKRQKEFANG